MSALITLVLVVAASNQRPVAAGMEVPNAIVQQHNAYVMCQDDHFDITKVSDRRTFVAEVEKAIAACKDQKTTLMQEAEKALASVRIIGTKPSASTLSVKLSTVTTNFAVQWPGEHKLTRRLAANA